jgi:hypothetical protein
VAHPFGAEAWSAFSLFAWQLAQVACAPREPECASWQLVQRAWPAGALLVSAAWHVAHAGFAVVAWALP